MPNLGIGLLSALLGKLNLGTTWSSTGKPVCLVTRAMEVATHCSVYSPPPVCGSNWDVQMQLIDKLTGRTYGCGE